MLDLCENIFKRDIIDVHSVKKILVLLQDVHLSIINTSPEKSRD